MKKSSCRWRLAALGLTCYTEMATSLQLLPKWNFHPVTRREGLGSAASAIHSVLLPLVLGHTTIAAANEENAVGETSVKFRAYSVIPDASASLRPEIVPIEV